MMERILKSILLILGLIFISGCRAAVNINISDEILEYSMDLYGSAEVENEKNYYENYAILPAVALKGMDEYFEKVDISTDDYLGRRLSYTYNVLDFMGSSVSIAYNIFSVVEDDNFYTIHLKNFNNYTYDYMDIEDIDIRVTTTNRVYKHNADRVEGNTYIWDTMGKDIEFQYFKSEYVSTETSSMSSTGSSTEEKRDNGKDAIIILAIGLGLFLIVLFVLIRIKRQKI